MTRNFARAFGWTVDAPVVVMLLLGVMVAVALAGYFIPEQVVAFFSPPPLEEEVQPTAPPPRPRERPQPLPDVDAVSLTDADVILVIDSEQFFTPEGAKALRNVVRTLEAQDYVEGVLWFDAVPVLNIFGLREPLYPAPNASARRFAEAKEKTLRHPLVRGQLLSADGRTALLMIHLNWLFVDSDEQITDELKQTAMAAAAEVPGNDFEFLLTGRTPMYLTYQRSQDENQFKYQAIGYGMVLLMAMILFRGLRAVVIVAAAPALGVYCTLGYLGYFGFEDNPFNDVVLPVLISLVGFTDGVHLMVEIRRRRAAGMSPRDAARTGIAKVGLACGLTSVTTAIGFASLSFAHHDVVREFGWSCVIGVITVFLSVITVIPLACSSRLGRNLHRGHEHSLIDRNLARIGVVIDFVLRHARLVSAVAVLVTVAALGVSLTLRPDERTENALPTGSEAARALRHMDQAFGGLERGSVEVNWTPEVPMDGPEVLTVLGEVHQLLEAEELIGHPVSVRSLVDALPGEGDAAERASMIELLPAPLKRAFYTPERRSATVTFRVQDLGIAKYSDVFKRIESGLREIEQAHPEFGLWLDGSPVRRWRNLHQIVVDLASSLGSASGVIFLVLTLAYRSIRLGLIAVVPNLFPLVLTGTYLVLTGQSLEIVSVCAFTVCLGIAVDDTIHFLTRYQEERVEHENNAAIQRAFIGTGTALIMTTVVLVTGMSTVILSDLREQRVFALMGGITIGSALFADLVFLPALLAVFGERRTHRPSEPDARDKPTEEGADGAG